MAEDEKPHRRTVAEDARRPSSAFVAGEGQPTGESYRPTDAEIARRNRRSILIALGVIGFIGLVYLITILRLGQAVSNGTYPG